MFPRRTRTLSQKQNTACTPDMSPQEHAVRSYRSYGSDRMRVLDAPPRSFWVVPSAWADWTAQTPSSMAGSPRERAHCRRDTGRALSKRADRHFFFIRGKRLA